MPLDPLKCYTVGFKFKIPQNIDLDYFLQKSSLFSIHIYTQAHLSLSTQKVSLQCAVAGVSLADRSGQTPSHSSGSHKGMVAHLKRKWMFAWL